MKDKDETKGQLDQAQEMLVKERNFVSAILETTGALVVLFDGQGRFIRINDAFEKTTGFSIIDIVGKFFWDVLLVPEDVKHIKEIFNKITGGEFPVEYQSKIISRDSKHRSIVWSMTALKEEKGPIEYIIGSGIDITDSLKAREMLNEANQNLFQSEKKYRSFVSNIPGSIYRSRLNGESSVEFLNNEIEKISGYPASDFFQDRKRTFSIIVHPDDLEKLKNTVQEGINKKEPYNFEYRIQHASGATRWVYERGQGVFDENGEFLWLDGMIFDITERKNLEREREVMIRELTDALNRVKTLRGLLPICSNCKKIRDDKGYWNQIEEYIKEYSDAEFSHGICPECTKKLYPEFYVKKKPKK